LSEALDQHRAALDQTLNACIEDRHTIAGLVKTIDSQQDELRQTRNEVSLLREQIGAMRHGHEYSVRLGECFDAFALRLTALDNFNVQSRIKDVESRLADLDGLERRVNDFTEYSIRTGERVDLQAQRLDESHRTLSELESGRIVACERRLDESDRKLSELGPYAHTFDRRIVTAERRIKRIKWYTLLIWPITAPFGMIGMAISKKISSYKRRLRESRAKS
jgi:DNA repair ATPase RecN